MLWVAWWLRGCRDTTVKGISVEWRIVVPLAGLVFVVVLVSWGYRLNPDLTSWLQPQPVLSSTYWFLFENGALIQWGQPQDWPPVARKYEIDMTIRNR
jgi:hypothetical protein